MTVDPNPWAVYNDAETWTVYGIPTFLTGQVEPGDTVAFSMVYEPTAARKDRWRIVTVKVVGTARARTVTNYPLRDS